MKDNIKRRDFLKGTGALGLAGVASASLLPFHSAKAAQVGDKSPEACDCVLKNLRDGRKIEHRIVATGDGHWFDHHITSAHKRLGKWANNQGYEERHRDMIAWLNAEIDGDGADFVVFNGDLVTNRPEHLPIIKEVYNTLKGKYYVTHGNHDHSSEENWRKIWGYGRDHSFTLGDYAVILLNSSNEKGKYECADHVWLQGQLNAHVDKAGVLVFCHIWQHGDCGSLGGVDCPEVTEMLLDAENAKMVVYSHTHRRDGHYPIFKSLNDGGRQLDAFFTGHFSAWGLPNPGYRVIEIYADGGIGTYAFDPANKMVVNWTAIG